LAATEDRASKLEVASATAAASSLQLQRQVDGLQERARALQTELAVTAAASTGAASERAKIAALLADESQLQVANADLRAQLASAKDKAKEDSLALAQLRGQVAGQSRRFEVELARLKQEHAAWVEVAVAAAGGGGAAAAGAVADAHGGGSSCSSAGDDAEGPPNEAAQALVSFTAKMAALEHRARALAEENAQLRRTTEAALASASAAATTTAAPLATPLARKSKPLPEIVVASSAPSAITPAKAPSPLPLPPLVAIADAEESAAVAAAAAAAASALQQQQNQDRLSAQNRELLQLRRELAAASEGRARAEEALAALQRRAERHTHALPAFSTPSAGDKDSFLSPTRGTRLPPKVLAAPAALATSAASAESDEALPSAGASPLSAGEAFLLRSNRHLTSALADEQAKLSKLFRHHVALSARYAATKEQLEGVLKGPLTPPLAFSTIAAREELFERERIRVEESESMQRENQLVAAAFYSLGASASKQVLTAGVPVL
jgi:hypothetical protein